MQAYAILFAIFRSLSVNFSTFQGLVVIDIGVYQLRAPGGETQTDR